ncbi:Nn.00g044450.m01.CDS01 [Neocucurbitaria sp. VM-36]
MSAVAEKHAPLISGLNKLYDTLTAMRYISTHDVVQPPHTAEAFSNDMFQTLGYESETIELMRLMPALRSEVAWGWQKHGTEILPRSKAVNYFIDRDTDWIEYLRWGDHSMSENHKLLPPWMLRLTIGQMYSGQYGTDLVYDTREQMIIEWNRTGTKLWDESPSRSADVILAEIVENFTNLEWVPYFDDTTPRSREIIENPICFQNVLPGGIRLPLDPALAIDQLRRELGEQSVPALREGINRWRSLQKLYEDCGWGTESYDGEEFGRRRRDWFEKLKELEKQGRLARRMAQAQREELKVAREAFWAESAGANAV